MRAMDALAVEGDEGRANTRKPRRAYWGCNPGVSKWGNLGSR